MKAWYGIKELHVEPTSRCNAGCPMCARNVYGKSINPYISLQSMSLNDFQKYITPPILFQMEKIFFCGNVGDPALTLELQEICTYIKAVNPDCVLGINTNGGVRKPEWWRRLGEIFEGPLDYVVFSIDGLEDTNHLYRRNVQWKKLVENVEAYISTGASAQWDTLLFEHNKHQIARMKELAYEKGFTWFRVKETDRWDTYTEIKNIRPVTPYVKPNYLNVEIDCEKDRDSSVFLDYTGKIWPCCHMAEAYLNKIGYELHTDLRKHNNLELFDNYDVKIKNNDPFFICQRACGKTMSKRDQWKEEVQLR